jgi:chemotaxis protein CheC
MISDTVMDALREIINTSIDRAAGTLSELLVNHISLEVPRMRIIRSNEFEDHFYMQSQEPVSMVLFRFSGRFSGLSTILFSPDSASKLVDMLLGEKAPVDKMDAIKTATLTEVGSIMLNAVMCRIGNTLHSRLNYSIPTYLQGNPKNILLPNMPPESTALEIATRFTIQDRQIAGAVLLLFEVGSFNSFVNALEAATNG